VDVDRRGEEPSISHGDRRRQGPEAKSQGRPLNRSPDARECCPTRRNDHAAHSMMAAAAVLGDPQRARAAQTAANWPTRP